MLAAHWQQKYPAGEQAAGNLKQSETRDAAMRL
jgi:hypothetical protein